VQVLAAVRNKESPYGAGGGGTGEEGTGGRDPEYAYTSYYSRILRVLDDPFRCQI